MRKYSLSLAFLVMLEGAAPSSAQRVAPVAVGSNYSLTTGSLTLLAGPGRAGRIRSLKYQGTEVLYVDSSSNNNNWGSTSWPSPQAYWSATCKAANPPNYLCGPPPVAVDAANTVYTGGLQADSSLSYTGAPDNATPSGSAGGGTGVRMRKTYWADADSTFTQRYTIVNTTAAAVAFAPWEITRFVSGGLSFYPTNTDTLRGTLGLRNMSKDTLGARWFKYDSTTMTTSGTSKILADGSGGWYAHVDKSRFLFIKKFKDTPLYKGTPLNTNEAECELYTDNRSGTSGGMRYQEMELQGPFDTIPAGDSIHWDVKWIVRKLPDSIAVSRNSALLAFVNQAVGATPSALDPSVGEPSGPSIAYSNGRVIVEGFGSAPFALSLVNVRGETVQRIRGETSSGGRHLFSLRPVPRGVYWLVFKGSGRTSASRVLVINGP